MREQERVRTAQNAIIIFSESLLKTSSFEQSGSGRRQIPTKPVMSFNKSSTFCPHRHQMIHRKHRQMTHLIHLKRKNQQST